MSEGSGSGWHEDGPELEELRARIDGVDREIIERLNRRVELAARVGRVKHAKGNPVYAPDREERVFAHLEEINGGPLRASALRAIYREIISASISLEEELVIGFLGPEATYTHQAARKNFGSSLRYKAYPLIADVFAAVEAGEAHYGVIPIENSSEGGVFHSMDLLAETELKIVAEIYLPIEHCLIGEGALEQVEEVASKDQALGQCRGWLRRNLPQARQVEASSTAEAVRRVRGEPTKAAVAGALAAELYGAKILARGIQDKADNVTRFLIVGQCAATRRTGEGGKTSLVFSIPDEVGALEKALAPFSNRGINLTKIESRPNRQKLWNYLFFIDFAGHWEDTGVREALAELREVCPMVKWLGSYPDMRAAPGGQRAPMQPDEG